jgi:hypothetical protein
MPRAVTGVKVARAVSPTGPGEIPVAVRRLFTEGFHVADIAEPLASFDAEVPGDVVAQVMDADGFSVAGVRRRGLVAGYVERDRLASGPCGAVMTDFRAVTQLEGSAPLSAAIRALTRQPRVFVTALGGVAGVVTPDDVQKPPARMWLFGMVTMIELRYTRLIAEYCPDGTWREYLSEGRLKKAESFMAERRRRSRPVGLLESLQLSDKGKIIARNEQIRSQTIFASQREAEDGIRLLEGLRNNLAHAQDIVSSDWEAVVQLSGHLDRALDVTD